MTSTDGSSSPRGVLKCKQGRLEQVAERNLQQNNWSRAFVVQQQDQSPERQGSDLQRKNSLGKRWKELVIDCISPNTKQVRLSFRAPGSPSQERSAARQLFADRALDSDCPPAPEAQCYSPGKAAFLCNSRYVADPRYAQLQAFSGPVSSCPMANLYVKVQALMLLW